MAEPPLIALAQTLLHTLDAFFMKPFIGIVADPVNVYVFSLDSLHQLTSCSTIGEGGDTMIPSPRRSPKHPLPGIGLHDPLHGRQACPESNSFHQGVGQICTR